MSVSNFDLYSLRERVRRIVERSNDAYDVSRHDYDRGVRDCSNEIYDIIVATIRKQNESGAQFDAKCWQELQNKNRIDCSDHLGK